jgi:predicted transcriptional regulator
MTDTKTPDYSTLPIYAGTLDYIKNHPGAQIGDIAAATGVPYATTRMRLLRLSAERAVRTERFAKALLFYPE